MRGTNGENYEDRKKSKGSPPHTRDKSNFICSLGRASGIIPAYAGQIKTALEAIRKSEDHTRIHGTNWN